MEIYNDNIYIKKALKYYLKLKNSKNEKIGLEYAARTLDNISKIVNRENFNDILNETETYCNNYIKNTVIEKNIDYIDYDKLYRYINNGDIMKIKEVKIKLEDIKKKDSEGNTLLHHCIKIGDYSILKILLENDVSINTINSKGNTLIEYACLCSDPNMIKFLTDQGANIKKNLFLRDKVVDNKVNFKLKTDNIDVACISKQLLVKSYMNKLNPKFLQLKSLVNFNSNCGFGNFTIENILIGISVVLDGNILDNYIDILKEELSFELKDNIFCYKNKMEIIIYNLIPFYDDYKFNLSQENLYLMEFNFLKKRYNKKQLINYLFENYIGKLMPEDFIGIQIKKILNI